MNELDTIARRHAEMVRLSVADAAPPTLALKRQTRLLWSSADGRSRRWVIAVAMFALVILAALPLVLSRGNDEAPMVSQPSIIPGPESQGPVLDPGLAYSGLREGIAIGSPSLAPGGWQVDVVTPTGEHLQIEVPAELGRFEAVTYWPIVHVLARGTGLGMLLTHSATAMETAQGVVSGADVAFASTSLREDDAEISHWTEVGRGGEVDIITISSGPWVLGIYDVLGGRTWGREIADALTLTEDSDGFLIVVSINSDVVVMPQSQVALTFRSDTGAKFTVRLAPTCDQSLPDASLSEGDAVLDDSGAWCISGTYQAVATASGSDAEATLEMLRQSLVVRRLDG